jgi:Protein of unknown function (DUF3500)
MSEKPLIALVLSTLAVSAVVVAAGGPHADLTSASANTAGSSSGRGHSDPGHGGGGHGSDSSTRAYRAQVVRATNAWLASLTDAQRDTATYSFDDTASKQQWSNFPAFFKPRTGVSFKDMSAAANVAGVALTKTALSEQGYTQFDETRKADDYLGATDTGGGPGGPGGPMPTPGGTPSEPSPTPTGTPTPTPTPVPPDATSPPATSGDGNGNFGRNNFYISVFGTPSMTEPFMISFNGHHTSYNLTFEAKRVANTPQFNGVEPSGFVLDNHTYRPMKQEADAVFGLLPKLPDTAKLTQSFDDVLVGPQKDGQFPTTHSGVKVSSLPRSARRYVTDLLAAYVGDVPAPVSRPLIEQYKRQYGDTYVSYAGGTADTPGTYLRIDGPQAWIEFAVQSTTKGSSHYHTVYRDKLHDYGA